MGEGWETARRRDDGNDYVELDLAGPGRVDVVELDTRYFVGNAPGWVRLTARDDRAASPPAETAPAENAPVELLPRQRLQPDTRHRFRSRSTAEVTHVRMDVYPDGGMSRVRLWGSLATEGRDLLLRRWFSSLPEGQVRQVLAAAGVPDRAAALDWQAAGAVGAWPGNLAEALWVG